MQYPVVVAYMQARELMSAKKAGKHLLEVSPDLGRSVVEVVIEEDGVKFPGGERLSWEAIDKISESETQCFLLGHEEAKAIQVFSEHTSWVRTLAPTGTIPTTVVAGFAMHRIKQSDPRRDTLTKLAALAPVVGNVLDIATGLGYTAIEAAKTATRVVTIELDPAAIELARLNPWSRELFENPRITQVIGDAFEAVQQCGDEEFARVLHDPPTMSLAGDLYGEEFYRRVYRVLARGGRMFHYIGDLEAKSSRRIVPGIVRRLQAAGFKRVAERREAFGLLAYK